mmetsp:Transcript_1279/g.1715  ORF Transcript_1279/g.1715 Transcript_1279/m.1715 type:complete len:1055 (+) Transcript_1279:212-3376(+)|eukprot:CAMPEP_0204877744 /NCGR_PEP_ID=MMETSP1348-20121228/48362_1 /ASSEMBLY_ACC=CAM_ASM_000700 /TAXON_ID=215587 /ORGANISM="Aplanochytrium stocchinoi, Strain GSBS06" /LENGTH=1054 /DNA_ID=CAMNT_0052034649 /DNA_START=175 /DNA_END=3339 /DNA_ORIENTATION=-
MATPDEVTFLANRGFPGNDNADFFINNGKFTYCFNPGDCLRDQNCSQSSDCAGDDFGCIKDITKQEKITICYDLRFARLWASIFDGLIAGVILLLALHVLLTVYVTFKNNLSARSRRLKKLRKAKAMAVEGLDNESAILAAELDDDDELDREELSYEVEIEDEDGNMKKELKTKRWSAAIRESEAMHKKYKEEVNNCLERNQQLINQIRIQASIVKVDTQVLLDKSLRIATMYRIMCLVFLKQGSLLSIPKGRVEEMVEELESGIEMLERASRSRVSKAEALLNKVQDYVLDVAEEIEGHQKHNKVHFDIAWDLYDPQFVKFQAKIYKELHPEDAYHTVRTLMLSHGIASTSELGSRANIVDEARRKRGFLDSLANCLRRFILLPIPSFVAHFPVFYSFFFGGAAITFAAFAVKVGNARDNLDVENNGGIRGTFLPVPGYYDVENDNRTKYWVPLLYAFMHCALYFLCWIPVPMTRGVLRDLSLWFPGLRSAVPIDDAYFFHKIVAMGTLGCIAIGGAIFVILLGPQCQNTELEDDGLLHSNACTGYDQNAPFLIRDNGFEWNPVQNVFMLRRIVLATWFTVFPMLHWANSIPTWAPRPLKKYWYEIWFYGHHLIAHVSVVLALIARFEVFFPTLGTWSLYYLDKMREVYFKTAKTEIVIRPVFVSGEENPDDASSTTIHLDDKNIPNSVRLLIEVPPGFKVNAGQWIYIKVPEISNIQWHPFSLASASRDSFVELHIGIRGRKDQWSKSKDADDPWRMTKDPTWTYKLYRAIRKRVITMASIEDPERQSQGIAPLYCKIRGPYGSTFTKCFDPHYYGSVIIGAGTGLTAAESVLRELFWRKRQKQRVPKYAWFIWSCQRVDDLLWAWQSLHKLLFGAVKDGILRPGKKWSEESLMMDWLGIYFYVSRADKERLNNFREKNFAIDSDDEEDDMETGSTIRRKGKSGGNTKKSKETLKRMGIKDLVSDTQKDELLARKIHTWMGNKRRLFLGSMDDPEYHVEKLFAWSRLFVDVKAGKHKRLASCFCGPPGLAHTLDRAARKVGNGAMQFSADHQ